jgi:hypothetical protein
MTKRALCIGINNYPGTGQDLDGCVNDATDWAAELTERDFAVTTLFDRAATKKRMLAAIRTLVESTARGDVGVITYGGHGTWVPDEENGDEADARDEALVPHDVKRSGPILDDDLFDIFADRERGARIIFLTDCCHSGGLASYAPDAEETDPSIRVPKIRFLPPQTFLDDRALARAAAIANNPPRPPMRSSALHISACRPFELAWDDHFRNRPNGAFTFHALRCLRFLGENPTYVDWFRQLRLHLPSRRSPQTPQLAATRSQRAWPVFG